MHTKQLALACIVVICDVSVLPLMMHACTTICLPLPVAGSLGLSCTWCRAP
jgi:hypothetical protein